MEATVYKADSDVYYWVTVDATATCKCFKYAISHGQGCTLSVQRHRRPC